MRTSKNITPPTWALQLLRWLCKTDLVEDIEGDMLERFHGLVEKRGARYAKRQFALEVLFLFRPGLIRLFFSSSEKNSSVEYSKGFILIQKAMFGNIIKTTFRALRKQKSYTLINILGLTVGLAASFLILLWIQDEYEVDNFHANGNRIYQLKRIISQDDGQNYTTIAIPQPLQIVLEDEFPEVEKVSLISWDIEALFKNNEKSFKESGKYASPEFLNIFSFPFIMGNNQSALNDISSIVISDNLARKLFGEAWKDKALGASIPVGNNGEIYKITGIFHHITPHSSLQFDWLINAKRYISQYDWVEDWNNGGFRMVVLMREDANMKEFGKKVYEEVNHHIQGDEKIVYQKFDRQYLYSNFKDGVELGGRIDYVRAMLIVAICIIVIACINFMNLATARSAIRVKEIGVRKVLGAGKNSLAFQFLTEAMVIAITGTLLAVILIQLILPGFNQITGKFITVNYNSPITWIMVCGSAFVAGLLSGFYPAFYLSSFNAITVIRGRIIKIGSGAFFRKLLVIFQFTISIVLIIGAIAISRQIQFILSKNLGLDRNNVVMLPLEGSTLSNYQSYRTELLRNPDISQVASSSQNPLSIGQSTGGASWDGKDPNFQIEVYVLSVDENFIKTLKMDFKYGNDFSGDFYRDSVSFIVNEKMAEIMGKGNAVGENLSIWGTKGKVVGVLRNFHLSSLHDPIDPLVIRYNRQNQLGFVRITNNVSSAISEIEKITKKLNPGFPFNYTFLDDQFRETYQSEIRVADLADYFTIITIFISCLGLFGLSSFIAQQRVKEIGIRKVMGASTTNLFLLLSLNFGKLILVAFILAVPIGYYFSNNWLDQFAFRVKLNPAIFIFAGLLAMIIAVATVSFKAIQTALANPVNTLKEE